MDALCRRAATCQERSGAWIGECVDDLRANFGDCQSQVSHDPCLDNAAPAFDACADQVASQNCADFCRDDWSGVNFSACRHCCSFTCDGGAETSLCLNAAY